MLTDNEKRPRRYAEVVKDSKNEEEIEHQLEQLVLEKGPAERSDHIKAPPPYIPRYGYFFLWALLYMWKIWTQSCKLFSKKKL